MDPDFWNTTDNCSIREFKHRVYPAAYLLTFSVGLLGNLLSLVFFLHSRRSRCLELDSSLLGTMIVLNRGVLVLGFVLPFAVIFVCYVLVAWHLLKRRRGVSTRHSAANHRRSCSLVIIVLLIFLSCFMPYHVVRTLFLEAEMGVAGRGPGEACHYLRRLREAAVVTHCLASGNSCLDPLLFFFVGENFVRFWKQYTPKRRSCVMEPRPVGT